MKQPAVRGKEMVGRPEGEYYADWDAIANAWCVFHTETARAYASFADEGQAKEEADKRNRPGDK